MFAIITYVQFLLIAFCLLTLPIIVLSTNKGYRWFCAIWLELYIAQLFMYYPGADVSPYMYSLSQLQAIRVSGFTLSAFTSILLVCFAFFDVILKHRRYQKGVMYIFVLAIVPNIIALFSSGAIGSNLNYFVKMIAPFAVFLYVSSVMRENNVAYFRKTITWINIIMIGQVLVCKVLYGYFSAYNYYYEMPEEYFGYYNHPHSFTGLLAFLAIWNIYEINKKRNIKCNLILFISNFILMYISGVRSYVVALVPGLFCIGVYAIHLSSMKRLRKYVYTACMFGLVFMHRLISSFGAMRVTADYSSGRITRWILDIGYAFQNYSLLELMIGDGLQASMGVSKILHGVYVNSLNVFVDMFLDYGIIGMILMTTAYVLLFKQVWIEESKGFFICILVTFVTASIITSVLVYFTIMSMIVVMLSIMHIEGTTS